MGYFAYLNKNSLCILVSIALWQWTNFRMRIGNDEIKIANNKYAGRDIVKGIPKWVDIATDEVREVLLPVFSEIVKLVSAVLKDTPPELSADIYQTGILLTGGGSLVNGVDEYIQKHIKVPVHVVANPLTCVAEGTRYLLKNRGNYLVNPLQM